LPGHQASEPRRAHGAHSGLRWSLGPAGPYRLAHRSMKSGLILPFTAGWTAQAAPARPKRQLALILLRRSTLQVRQYLRNELHWNGLQRKELLPGPWTHRDAVGDRVAQQVIQRTSLRICAKPGILEKTDADGRDPNAVDRFQPSYYCIAVLRCAKERRKWP
jgi:hypothetical protein